MLQIGLVLSKFLGGESNDVCILFSFHHLSVNMKNDDLACSELSPFEFIFVDFVLLVVFFFLLTILVAWIHKLLLGFLTKFNYFSS